MKKSIAAIILLALMGSSDAAPHSDAEQTSPAIIGGSPANIADFPFQLSMHINGSFACGASIISLLWALTAAHCFDDDYSIPAINITFRAGSAHHSAGGKLYTAKYYKMNDDFDIATFYMDVAVVKVTEAFAGINIAIIPLAPQYRNTPDGSSATVSGWGLLDNKENSSHPTQLFYVAVPIVNQDSCHKSWIESKYKMSIFPEMICAGKDGYDSCNGDSGGPLTSGGLQIGIVSFGDNANCGGPLPGVYTRVSDPSVRKFITDETGV